MTPARWLTLTGLAWVAALITAIMTFATAVLAAMGRDVSLFLVPQALAFTCMGCVLLARRPGHPMGPLLCLIGLAIAISQVPFAYARYALVHSPGSLPFSTAMLWTNTWAYAPAISPRRLGPADGLPRRKAAVAAVASRTVGGAGFHPTFRCRLRLHPAEHGQPLPQPARPVHRVQARRVVQGNAGPGRYVRAGRRRRSGSERDAALAPGRPGTTPAAQVVPRRDADCGRVVRRNPDRPGPWSLE